MKLLHTSTVETSLYCWRDLKAKLAAKEPIPEEGQYLIYRIPGLVEAPNGDLLAYFECRTGGDWSAIDIGMRRSTDGGRSWSDREILATGRGRATTNNPVMIVDGDRVHLLYCENYKRLFHRVSLDCGPSWSEPIELTAQVDATAAFFWSCLAVGPGHGIRTESGRLIVPIWFACNALDIYSHQPSLLATLYSDDGGETWQVSAPLTGEDIPNPNESALVQLPDGNLLMSIRNENEHMLRAFAVSDDDGTSFSNMALDPTLPDPICQGSVCAKGDGILLTNCNSQIKEERDHLTLRYRDANSTPIDVLELNSTGGYSDICYSAKKDRAYVLYECDNYRYMRLAEVSFEK